MKDNNKYTVKDVNGNVVTLVNPGVLHNVHVRARIDEFNRTYNRKDYSDRNIGFNEEDYNIRSEQHNIQENIDVIRNAQLNQSKRRRKIKKK